MNLFPLCTANVWPTNSGVIIDLRDQVLIACFLPPVFIATIFFSRCGSTKGPFFSERAIYFFLLLINYFLRLSRIYLFEAFLSERVFNPFAFVPFLERGCPPDARPSPPPIG